jgi:protein tyrosine/serine phosphatase
MVRATALDRTTSPSVRRAIYTLHHALRIVRRVLREPLARSSWGVLLNLPCFAVVEPGRIYRSGAPRAPRHYEHLLSLGVRTLVCVRGGGASAELRDFARTHGLRLREYDLGPDCAYDDHAVAGAAAAALDAAQQPALIFCDGGRHRAGMVVAMVRLRQGHSLDTALAEYYACAEPWPFEDNVLFIARCHAQRG